MRFGSTTTLPRGVTPAASVTTTDRLVFIKKVYSLLAMSMGTAAIGAYLGSGPLLLLVAPNMMLFFILQIGLIFFASFAARKPGLNMIALFSFTTISGLTLGPLLYQVGPSIAAEAFALTAITFRPGLRAAKEAKKISPIWRIKKSIMFGATKSSSGPDPKYAPTAAVPMDMASRL